MAPAYQAVPARLPVDLVRAVTQTLTQCVRDGLGSAATVLSGTITITAPDGTVVVSADPIVVVGDDATYELTALKVPASLAFSSRWVVKWVLVTAGGTVYSSQPASLVAAVLPPPIDQADVLTRHAPLAVQFDPDQMQVFVDAGWTIVLGWIVEKGHQPYEILGAWRLAEILIAKSASLAFREASFYTNGAGAYAAFAGLYEKQALDDFGTLGWEVDADQDGVADDDVDGPSPGWDFGMTGRGPS